MSLLLALQTGGNTSSPSNGVILFSGKQPTSFVLDPKVSSPGKGAIVFTGRVPSVFVLAPKLANPASGLIVFSGKQPSSAVSVSGANPGAGRIVFTGFSPSTLTTQNRFAAPQSGFVAFTGLIPDVFGGSGIFEVLEPQKGGVRKRRRILPDGRQIYATDYETAVLLRQYRQQKRLAEKAQALAEQTSKIFKPSVSILPKIVFEDTDRLKRLKEEEEWLVLMD